MRLLVAVAATLGMAATAIGCSGDSGGGGGALPVTTTGVSGTVVVGAPVVGATVGAFQVDVGSRRLTRLASTKTDAAGAYSLSVALGTKPVLLVATGGSYKDDATGAIRSLADVTPATVDDPRPGVLEALLGSGTPPAVVHVTPVTTIGARRAITQGKERVDAFHEEEVKKANQAAATGLRIAGKSSGFDPRAVAPLDYTNPAHGAAIKADPFSHAAVAGATLGGLSRQAQSLSLASVTLLVDALARDFEDGVFDGAVQTGAGATPTPVPLGSGTLSPTAARADLLAAKESFLNDTARNVSGTTAAEWAPQ